MSLNTEDAASLKRGVLTNVTFVLACELERTTCNSRQSPPLIVNIISVYSIWIYVGCISRFNIDATTQTGMNQA